jgi:beta-glucosidase/6-phospho-beta-glucosidase/beta-galactosidase
MPDGFLWGAATAAYQIEGGLNGDGEPANNWGPWDRSGRVERCGAALDFWRRPERLLDLAAGLGCNAFRMSVEWARVQPSAHRHVTIEPDFDDAALDGYADILCECRRRGMEPIVTLLHFTHPLWCGEDFWLAPDSPRRFESYVRRCVRELGRRLVDRGQAPVRWWITINEPAVVPLVTYVMGQFPGHGRGVARMRTAYDHTIAAHVGGYDAVHDVYAEEGWVPPVVSINTFSTTAVALDALLVDLLLAREHDVPRARLGAYLRAAHVRARRRLASVERRGPVTAVLDAAVDRLTRLGGLAAPHATADALYASSRARKLDWVSFDYYDPVFPHYVGPGSAAARRLRTRPGVAELWEQRIPASGMAVFLRQAHLQVPDRPIVVAENGLCTPGMRPRPDGVRRDEFIRAMTGEVLRARAEGIDVAGYLHWTLADNYEWGSYAPRFGLYGVDFADGRILPTDASGVDAAGAYRDIIAGP